MTDDLEKDLFVSDCIRLSTFITMYSQTGYTDRVICSVLSQILKEVINRQDDPQKALDQLIRVLKERNSAESGVKE